MAKTKKDGKPPFVILADRADDADAVDVRVRELTGQAIGLSASYKANELTLLLIQYGLDQVLEAVEAGFVGYKGNMAMAIEKLGGILYNRAEAGAKRRRDIGSDLSLRLDGFVREEAEALLRLGALVGGDAWLDEAEEVAGSKDFPSWGEARTRLLELLAEYSDGE